MQPVKHEVIRRILGGADFLHDDILLAPQFFGIKSRVRQNVGQHIERQRHVSFQYARKIACLFDARRSVEIAAHRLDRFRDLARRAAPGSLEGHMFK